jgi:hypothetical protein
MDEKNYNPLLHGHKLINVLCVDDGCIQEKIRASEYALEKRGENQSKA